MPEITTGYAVCHANYFEDEDGYCCVQYGAPEFIFQTHEEAERSLRKRLPELRKDKEVRPIYEGRVLRSDYFR